LPNTAGNYPLISTHLNLSNQCIAAGDTEEALKHLYKVLQLDPRHVPAYNNLGRLLYKQGRVQEAIPYFEKALRMDPNYGEAHYNLALSLSKQNQLDRAVTHYQETLRLFPEHPNAHFNVGLIYVEESNYPLAENHLSKALALEPNNIEALRQLGQVYVQLGKIEPAIEIYQKALLLSPNLGDVYHNLAILYLRNQNHAQALVHFQKALELDPRNDTAKHMISALSALPTSAAPSEYIARLFDQYADYYDTHLKTQLNYQVPGLLRNAVGRCLGSNPKAGRILDLGCGTGLCGVMFRDLALELIGVDLSPKMIEKSTVLGAYDKLIVSDLNPYLSQVELIPFDLIIAGDVLVYSGDLEALFINIAKNLALKGLFAFSTEFLERGNYSLQTTGRFAHSSLYIRELAQNNGFLICAEEMITLREQAGVAIQGQIFVLSTRTQR